MTSAPATTASKKAHAMDLLRQNRLPEARTLYQQICQENNQDAEVWFNLSAINGQLDRHDEAINCCRQAIRIRPEFTEAYHNLGNALQCLGKNQEAAESYRRALQINPDLFQARLGEVNALEKMDDLDNAWQRLQPLLDADNVNADVALAFADLCHHAHRGAEAAALMERLLAGDPPLNPYYQMRLHFSLGALYDVEQQYDTAFGHYQQANALDGRQFDPKKYAARIDRLRAVYSTEFLARAPRATVHSQRPVFIVGMSRSGTSLTEQILASHSQVHGAGELKNLQEMVRKLPNLLVTDTPYPECLLQLTQHTCNELAADYLEQLEQHSGEALRITDKMPQNFHNLGLIALLFPKAHVIHCVREPLDTCLSCYFLNFLHGNAYAYDLKNLGVYYRHYQRLMEHWKTVLDLPIFEVRYEELVADPESVSRAMVEFCGLDWEQDCLRFHDNPRFVHTASYRQVRRPVYTSSIDRWKNYAAYIQPLCDGLGDAG